MRILVDGYNFLHVTGVFIPTPGPHALQQLHLALLDFLADRLPRAQAEQTTVVFDAKGRRASERRTIRHRGITAHYASRHETADAYLTELLQAEHAPRQLLVVSSDHQVQRAARRRRAKTVDSEDWYRELQRERQDHQPDAASAEPGKPDVPLPAADVADWIRVFAADGPPAVERTGQTGQRRRSDTTHRTSRPRRQPSPPADPPTVATESATRAAAAQDQPDSHRPAHGDLFPPDYLEEIAREIDDAHS